MSEDDSLEFLESSGPAETVYAGDRCEWRKSSRNRCTYPAHHVFMGAKVCDKHLAQLQDVLGQIGEAEVQPE